MQQHFTLQYWVEGEQWIGRVKELPGLMVEGRHLAELEARAADACRAVATHESRVAVTDILETRVTVEVFATTARR